MRSTKRPAPRRLPRRYPSAERLLAALLSILLVAALSSCSGGGTDSSVTDTSSQGSGIEQLTFPRSGSDSLDPYRAASSVNIALSQLMYEGLFRLDDSWSPVPVLASTCTVAGTALTVDLSPSARFSDGSAVTGADVVYSFEKARVSTACSASLGSITSCAVNDRGEAVFTMSEINIFAVDLLTFPIVKSSTADDPSVMPVGTGSYVYDKAGDCLLPSPLHPDANVKKIAFYDELSDSSAQSDLTLGRIDLCWNDLSSGSYERTDDPILTYDLNDLVFIGVNSSVSALSNPAVRRALSVAADRKVISSTAWQGYAQPALTPFDPLWTKCGGAVYSEGAKAADARSLLSACGYTSPAGQGVTLSADTGLSFTMIIPSGNRFKADTALLLTKQFAAAGVTLKVKELDAAAFSAALQSGSYDLYLGELKLRSDMDLSAFFTSGGSAAWGVAVDKLTCASRYTSFISTGEDVDGFLSAFYTDTPFIPLVYRCGIVCSGTELDIQLSGHGNIFSGIDLWSSSAGLSETAGK